ncbi:class I SAM-dependent methyltransferase [Halomonas sp. M20]|uniref:class I SAM-dependent methyltransferase n=1 Tax=Halomonas sp. M20 TaxID=2763264 RepID=UPI001D0B3AAB|nr:class I SAM-dependent methyltransferase [Halomonas sp. M20]
MSFTKDDFDTLYAQSPDPWGYEHRWYEARKRALCLAMLTRPYYKRVFEPGCSIGVMSEALLERCDTLLGWDLSAAALETARKRLAQHKHVTLEQHRLPDTWPEGKYDLVVFSELGYFLDRSAMDVAVTRLSALLEDGGEVLACHWRHPIEGGEIDGETVHRLINEGSGLTRLSQHLEEDVIIELWSKEKSSVARRDGLI